jgi:demethoxyubiquinone hydroxylase (CLK1/Coq7/Cat5 family)
MAGDRQGQSSDTRAGRREFARQLRVIHACEKGATGVYWGHRLVASLLNRDVVPVLTQMHAHEMEHFALFGDILRRRGIRHVFAPGCGARAASPTDSSPRSVAGAPSGKARR